MKRARSRIYVLGKSMPTPMIDEPLQDEYWVHDLLVRWGEWCRPTRVRGKARSAEGRHVAEKGNVYEAPEPRKVISIAEVQEVNAVIASMQEMPRNILRARYYARLPDKVIAKRFRIIEAEYQSTLRAARLLLHRHLLFRIGQATIRPDNSLVSSDDEVDLPMGGRPFPAPERSS